VVQEDRQSEDLAVGSRGGIAVRYSFRDGEYRHQSPAAPTVSDYSMGMAWPQHRVRVDGNAVKRCTIGGKALEGPSQAQFRGAGNSFGDQQWRKVHVHGGRILEIRTAVKAGPRVLVWRSFAELWNPRCAPTRAGRVLTNDEGDMGMRAWTRCKIGGPYQTAGRLWDWLRTRRAAAKNVVCQPDRAMRRTGCAGRSFRAWPPWITAGQSETRHASDARLLCIGGGMGKALTPEIQFAMERLLVDPEFLVRVERDPTQVAPVR